MSGTGLVPRSICFVVLALLALPVSAAAQKGAFSLEFQLRDAADDRVRSDGGPYVDLSEGRAPNVYAIDGNIAVGLEQSTRRLCLDFADHVSSVAGRALPLSGCYPALVHVRFGITDLTPTDPPLLLSFVVYWTGRGSDGRTYDYNLGFRPRDNNGVLATAVNGDAWTIDPTSVVGRVYVFLNGKNGGWQTVADYVMPFAATAYRMIPNLRK